MSRKNLSAVVRYLHQLTHAQGGSSAGDAELLERYIRHRDEAAFELLLWRHGTMVFNVCRRLLPREQDAEDAFQATFLTFVRKSSSISSRGSVAAWLYKVAYRVALAARARGQKIALREKTSCEISDAIGSPDPTWADLRPILDEEVNRLPERLRRPFVLCYLEGKTNEEAAQQLGCPPGTIFSRLARGRELLRHRLQRRGVTLSVAVLTAALTAHAVEAMPTKAVMAATLRSTVLFAAGQTTGGVSTQSAALAEGVLRTMFVIKMKIAAVMLLVIGVAAGGVWTYGQTAAPQTQSRAEDRPTKQEGEGKTEAKSIPVRVVKPMRGGSPLMVLVKELAEVVAAQHQQVVPLISGTIKEVRVDIGDRVKLGQTLIVIDAPLLDKEVELAASALDMATAQLEEGEAQMVMAKAELESAKAALTKEKVELSAAKTRLKSAEEMAEISERNYKTGALPAERLLESRQKVVAARGQVQLAEPAIATAEADVQVKMGKLALAQAARRRANANVNASKAAVDKARIQVSFTQVKAAFDGVITRRTIDSGNFVQVSDSRLLRPLLTVQRIDTVRVVVRVSNQQAPLIERGMPVAFWTPDDRRLEYKVSRFSPSLDEAKRQMTVEIDVPNADNRLLPGMEFWVGMPFHKTSTDNLIVPSDCIFPRRLDRANQPRYVFIVRNGKAHRQEVDVEFDDQKNAEISDGIQATDLLILKPEKIKDGMQVTIEKAP